ncbi:MAG: hypothetical protein V4684_19560 [Pseudomonadota bacterium]
MTTPWKAQRAWSGETVAVLASGPSLTREVADELACFKRIAVNYSFVLAPEADMLVALDLNTQMWADAQGFIGLRVCGVDDPALDALYAGPCYERISIAPGHVIETRNSGLAAIRIAAEMGAARIVLAGFDPGVAAHFMGRPHVEEEPDPARYPGLAEGLDAIVSELRKSGIDVIFHTKKTIPSLIEGGRNVGC